MSEGHVDFPQFPFCASLTTMEAERTMADIKEKLQRLKKEREARSRSQAIKEQWEVLEKKQELTTKEKLEQLIQLRPERPEKPHAPSFEPIEREPLRFTENPYNLDARYGNITLSDGLKVNGNVLVCLSQDSSFEHLDLSTALFIDLETSGLSGGTGVVPFNIGLGYYRDDQFWICQYFLGDLAEEERMIGEFERFVSEMDFQSIVTYNGKAFDIPLLETRFILHQKSFPLADLPHLDFLFPARSLWGHKHENCRLAYLASEVLHAVRIDDISPSEIPWRYFQYLQTGNFELIEPVLYHNAEDILALLGVVIAGALIFSEDDETCLADGMDFYGAGKVMERAGHRDEAALFYKRALDGSLSEKVGLSTRRRLSLQYKKKHEWDKAVFLWKEMASSEAPSSDLLFSLRELAMYLEHREKNYTDAEQYAEEGYVLARGFSQYYERDFSHRRERLQKKRFKSARRP